LVSEEDSVVSEIKVEDFENIIGGSLEVVLLNNEKSHEKKMTALTNPQGHPANSVKLEDLVFIKKLGIFLFILVFFQIFNQKKGFGQFGSVYLVRPKNKKDLYALKSVSKQQVLEQKLERHVQVIKITNFISLNYHLLSKKESF